MGKLVGALIVATVVAVAAARAATTAAAPLDFLEEGHCYRIALPIDSAPNYKLLEILGAGWLKAEGDAGSAKAQRQSFWINSAQIVTVREVRCSE